MARFFIDRPIFAWVIALFILVMGSVSVKLLPVAQYPTVAPPSITVSTFYPGASAQTLDDAAAHEVLVDNFVDIFPVHVGVPHGLGIDDHHRTLLAAIKAARLVDADLAGAG